MVFVVDPCSLYPDVRYNIWRNGPQILWLSFQMRVFLDEQRISQAN